MTPSLIVGDGNWAVKSDSLLGYKTIDGKYYPREMSVVRATTGTRINEAGLVELVPYNFVQYSQEFDNAYWTKFNCTITANNAVAPDGTNSADRLVLTSISPNAQTLSRQSPIVTTNTTVTFSTFVKYVDKQYIQLVFSGGFSLQFANFDLINGTVTNGTYVSANVQSYANGWYRISITTTGSNTNCLPFIWAIDTALSTRADNSTSTGTSAYLIWGAQIVDGTQPLDYLPTTTRLNIPRIDYSTGSPALLLEPQRTNLALQSSSFDSASWGKLASSATANTTISPSGIQDADTLTADGTTSTKGVNQSISVVSGTAYSMSFYAKKNTNDFIQLAFSGAIFSTNSWANFDLNNGVVGSLGSAATSSIQNVGDGWYRCTITATATATATNLILLNIISSATSIRNESNTLSTSVFLWGAQLEAGSYPTSYIPTTSASVTRNADVCDKTSATDLIGQTEGTVLIDIDLKLNNRVQTLWSLSDGISTSEFILVYHTDVNTLSARMRTGGVDQVIITTATLPQGRYKLAMAYKENDVAFYVNGSLVGTDNSCAVPSPLNKISLTQIGTIVNIREGFTKGFALYKERLSNSELATLTTL